MGELRRFDEGLPPEVVALAQALRDLFMGLGISTRRYAARRAYDSSTVSRFLGGRRPPPWEFVLNLLHDVAEERGTVPTEETIGMLRELHTTALQAGNSPVHKMQLLQRQLAEADQEARRAAMRERLLEDTLQDREHRIRDLQMRYRELQAASVQLPPEEGVTAPPGGPAEEHARLRTEIHDLQAELGRVRALHRQAEERCEQLERQLTETEKAAGQTEGIALPELLRSNAGDRPMMGDGASGAPGIRNHFEYVHGDINVIHDGWLVDEEYVESLTVRVVDEVTGHRGNGLLVDAETVVTVGHVLSAEEPGVPGPEVTVLSGERSVRAVPVESHTVDLRGFAYPVVVLRLSGALPFPERPLTVDLRPTTGSQLLVSAYSVDDRYSCLLDVKGRTGDSLRVSGEIADGLGGAPAFSSTGGLAGLLAMWDREKDRGHVLPASTLLALTTVNLST
ncbi:hypothetical protein BX264_2318 [Streptomyces sp. 2333.5]|nr:hypothetical protein BX264_2318 [Streptomyces sp. 2333.5]SEC90868.1 hypothetical protein SAMN05428943_2461 [Streptomyces sp. 2314.4]SED76266.1 hypothetical protein SAMN05428942_2420 [Streptomyces sp. 2112.2]